MKTFRKITLRRDSVPLALHVEEGRGPVAFFQHGLCGDAAQPASVFPQDAGIRLAVLDCRGHGESETGPFDKLSIATFTDDVATAIAEVANGPCVVGGISMGAAIAMRLACLRPDLVSGLVIARPAWGTEAAPANMRPNLIVGQMLSEPPQPDEAERFRASETGAMLARSAPDNLASLTGFFTRQPRPVTAALLCRISRDGPGIARQQLAALTVPTLVIGHGEDVIHPLALARDVAGIIPNARLAEIPPKTHGRAAYEDAFRTELARFLKEVT